MQDVEVIESAQAAAAALDPVRARLLGELAVPASAAGLAARVGIARQKVNYHLRALEAHGLVELSEERHHGGITERVLQASAAAYVVSPAAVSASAADPDANADHLSASYLVALAGRIVREVGALAGRAGASGQRLPTMTIVQTTVKSPSGPTATAGSHCPPVVVVLTWNSAPSAGVCASATANPFACNGRICRPRCARTWIKKTWAAR